MRAQYLTTTDAATIQDWADKRGGKPARLKQSEPGQPESLEIFFPDYGSHETLDPVEWDEFFQLMEEQDLVFVYEEETANGEVSRMCKLVSPDVAREMAGEQTEEPSSKIAN